MKVNGRVAFENIITYFVYLYFNFIYLIFPLKIVLKYFITYIYKVCQ